MWLLLAFTSAALLGFYDVFKKQALKNNAVVPVLTLNTLFSSLIFLPLVVLSAAGRLPEDSLFYVPVCGWEVHRYIVLKAVIVLASWLCGYYAIKHLPLTLVGPINATRPVMVLLGAVFVFGERLNLYQWIGVLLAILGFFLLSRSGKKEGINFRHNRWVVLAVLASAFGAVSALYDKYLMASPEVGGVGLNRMAVQSYFVFYQFLMMMAVWIKTRPQTPPVKEGSGSAQLSSVARLFPLRGSGERGFWVFLISLFLSAADFVYFYALTLPGALISVVSMIRRSSVLVSFTVGAWVFHEKNLRSKAVDLVLVLLSMVFLWMGSQ
ncbi:MAG: DMT family transporter [Bacteroidaceae bacterium]|nr:DMT family transporter [Bacteroidaceae bacterium]MBR1682926.1 DMT family transporter [Bacteroidaceae bacterium]MBR1800018.1 DMT family transporter [Bacteroidaceae bacterium]